VRDVVYDDVCIRETKSPIVMEPDYMHFGHNGDKAPTFTGIVLRNVRLLSGGKITFGRLRRKVSAGHAIRQRVSGSAAGVESLGLLRRFHAWSRSGEFQARWKGRYRDGDSGQWRSQRV
jgi:hypothetical protein